MQTRITISEELADLANSLIKITGCNNHASLYGLLLTRYGNHLSQTWHVLDTIEPERLKVSQSEPTFKPIEPKPQPKQHPEVAETVTDPVIARISGLVDNF